MTIGKEHSENRKEYVEVTYYNRHPSFTKKIVRYEGGGVFTCYELTDEAKRGLSCGIAKLPSYNTK
jgi:hypothetical protein